MSRINTEKQLEQWIDKYQNLIYSICLQLTKDYFDAQDLTQETFLSAYKNLAYFDGRNEKAWLCKIASRKCLDYLKHSGRKQIPTDSQFLITCSPTQPPPEKEAMDNALHRDLYDCCMKLKEPYRQVALDYFYHEMEPVEIAEKRGKNLKTIQTQIYRAKAMLRKLYRKEDLLHG